MAASPDVNSAHASTWWRAQAQERLRQGRQARVAADRVKRQEAADKRQSVQDEAQIRAQLIEAERAKKAAQGAEEKKKRAVAAVQKAEARERERANARAQAEVRKEAAKAEREARREAKAVRARERADVRSWVRDRQKEEKEREAEDKRERLQTEEVEFDLEANEYYLALKRADAVADEQERWEQRDIIEASRKLLEGNQRGARRWAKWRQERLKVTQQVRDVGLAEQTRSEAGRQQVWQAYHKTVLWYRYGTSKDWQRAEKWLDAWREQEAQRQQRLQQRELEQEQEQQQEHEQR